MTAEKPNTLAPGATVTIRSWQLPDTTGVIEEVSGWNDDMIYLIRYEHHGVQKTSWFFASQIISG